MANAKARKDLLDKDLLDAETLKHKKSYLDMLVSQFNTPIMREACENAKKDADKEGNKERAKAMQATIEAHDRNIAAFEEAKELAAKTVDFLN